MFKVFGGQAITEQLLLQGRHTCVWRNTMTFDQNVQKSSLTTGYIIDESPHLHNFEFEWQIRVWNKNICLVPIMILKKFDEGG